MRRPGDRGPRPGLCRRVLQGAVHPVQDERVLRDGRRHQARVLCLLRDHHLRRWQEDRERALLRPRQMQRLWLQLRWWLPPGGLGALLPEQISKKANLVHIVLYTRPCLKGEWGKSFKDRHGGRSSTSLKARLMSISVTYCG